MEEGRRKNDPSPGRGSAYERLAVYQRSYQAAVGLHQEWASRERGFPREDPVRVESDVLRQLCRASRSIPANIAEGVNRSNSAEETRRFLGMAWRSCDEVRVWLCFCRDLHLAAPERVAVWEQEYAEIGAMLYRLWQNWKHYPEG